MDLGKRFLNKKMPESGIVHRQANLNVESASQQASSSMESQEQQEVKGGASERPRERKRGGGSTGLVVGIATVVVVGVAGKLLQRFNSINRSNKAPAAVAKDSIADEGQQSCAAVLKTVLSIVGDHGTHIVDGASTDAEEKCIGCDTPVAVDEKTRPRSFDADAEISDQDSFSENSDSKGSAEIQVKHPLLEKEVVAADHHYHEAEFPPPPPCQKLETDLPAQTSVPGLVHQPVKHEMPFDEVTLRKAKDLQEVISRAIVDFGRGELPGEELAAPKKLKLQFVWDDKPGPDAVEIFSDSGSRSETPVPCYAHDNSEGSAFQPESVSDLGNVVSEVMDAHDTDTTATGDELDSKFMNAGSQIEDTRMNSEVSGSETTDWPQAITFNEFINSVQATTSAESNDQLTVDDAPARTDSVAENGSSVVSRSDPQTQTDHHYCACQHPSVVHDDAEEEAEFSLGESETIYEKSHEEAEGVLQDETESKSPEISEDTEPAVGDSLSSLKPEATISSAYVHESAEEVDRTTVRTKEEGSAKYTTEEKVVPQQQVTDGTNGWLSSLVGLEDLTLRNAQAALGQKEIEDATTRAKSPVVLLPKTCDPNNSLKHSTGNISSAKITKSAILTTMEFTSPANNWGSLKHLEVLRMAVLIVLIAAMIFMIREHHLKPLKHAA